MQRYEVIELIQRAESVYYRNPRDADAISKAAGEWEKILKFCNTRRINEALTQYISEKHRYGPTPGQLLDIYKKLEKEQEERQRQAAVDSGLICRFCNRGIESSKGKFALAVAADGAFWGVYPVLGLPCPCTRAGEMAALKRGQHVHRKVGKRRDDGRQVYIGDVELWLDERGDLVGRAVRGFVSEGGRRSEDPPLSASAVQSRQGKLVSPEDWVGDMELPF